MMTASTYMSRLVSTNITMMQAFEEHVVAFIRANPGADLAAVKRQASACLDEWEAQDPERQRAIAALDGMVGAIFNRNRSRP